VGVSVAVRSRIRDAERLVDYLIDEGPSTRAAVTDCLDWTDSRFSQAVKEARDNLCPPLGLAIPAPTPAAGWLYQVTTEWDPVAEGAAFVIGGVESRLASINRDVGIILPHLTRGTTDWRRANFLRKHLTHILGTLREIDA
jgi:hypothetical protein